MTDRLRIQGFHVQIKAFADDGENLTELPVQAVFVPLAEWPNVVTNMEAAVEQLRIQVEGPPLHAVADES